ncbi:zinc finger protein 888-like [Toxorhynchites rutilus septentrionalis]|uniref:zinc finger protein 888-like n=1 Tax=Toxorhynchites rutilus septentrionalis TaxID=329112 RepID=UPI0024784ED4|nr:zinc finger protein 888-like [Toxorhynchites rutilus septentrionalis]
MNLPESVCRTCLAECIPMVNLFSSYDLPAAAAADDVDEQSSTSNVPIRIQLSSLYTDLTQIPLDQNQQQQSFPCDSPISAQICLRCAERLKDFYLFRRRAVKAYEELQTKASIAQIINQLDHSSMGSVRNDRLEEDFAEDLIAEDKLGSCFKKPLAEGELRCDNCRKVFKSRKMLLRHQEIHSSENKYKCRYCGRWFRARSSWYNHELKHRHAVDNKEKLEREFLCEICAKSFKTKKQLVDHLAIVHEGVKRFHCDICNKSFTRNGSLAEHKLIQHAGIKQFSCNICGKAFGKEDSLKTHRSVHLGKRFKCEVCSKTFLKNAFLTAHIAKAHPTEDGPKPNKCEVCGKIFSSSSHLKDHSLIHSDTRPEICRLCGASFRQKQQLKVHMYQHMGKPFKCQFCTAAFGIRTRLTVHMQKNHPTEVQNLESQSQQQQETLAAPPAIINEPDFGDGAINEEILNEICYQIDANQIVLQNIEDDGVNLIYSSNEHIVFFDDGNNLLPEEIEGVDTIGQLYDFGKHDYVLPAGKELNKPNSG